MSDTGTTTVIALDRETLERIPIDQFTDDIARNIHEPEAIAARYGLTPAQALAFCARPEITKLLRLKRAIWESDTNIPERFRTYCQVGLLEASPKILSMLQDDTILPAVRVDLVKTLTRVCGVEAPQPRYQSGDLAPAAAMGPTFSVNILFAGRTESISTTVIHEALTVVDEEDE